MARGEKTRKRANYTPKLDCPFIGETLLWHTTDSIGALAAKTVEFMEAVAEWKKAVRKHFADGGSKADVPKFAVSKFVNPNTGRLTRKQQDALVAEYNKAIDDGAKTLPSLPPVYNPVQIDLLHVMNCQTTVRRGLPSKHPKPPSNWDEKRYGSWYLPDENGDLTVPSGWFFDKGLPRRSHADNIMTHVDNPEQSVVTVGKTRYVVGDGTVAGSAIFAIRAHKGGNYGACDQVRKSMSLAKVTGLANLIFKIEDKPNLGGAFRIRGNWRYSSELCFLPGQVLTAGHLMDGENILTPAQIRKLESEKSVKFVALAEPIVGAAVPWRGDDGLWKEIQRVQGSKETKKQRERTGRSDDEATATPQAKAIRNALVECRCSPDENYPFGLKSVQVNVVPYVVADPGGKVENGDFAMGVVIGARSNFEYSIGVNEAKRANREAEAETETPTDVVPEVEEVKKSRKSKKPADKAETKPKKPRKSRKEKKDKDAAPPIEVEAELPAESETSTDEIDVTDIPVESDEISMNEEDVPVVTS